MNIQERFQGIQWEKLDRLSPIILLLLILALCWKLASVFWWVLAPPQVIQPEPVVLGSKQTQVPNISSFSLFYEQGASTSVNDNLAMQLQGVMVASSGSKSSAVIKVGETAERYLVGDSLGDSGYQLAAVYWEHVVLKQSNGATRELKFTSIGNLYQPDGAEQAAEDQNKLNNVQTSTATTSQNALGQAIEQMGEDKDDYLKKMGVNTGGQGYEVTEQTPSALRSKLGLKPGDRILSLNGKSVGQGQSDVQLLEQAKREGKVKIEIKRGDQTMTLQQDL